MSCFHPISAFQTVDGAVVFSELGRYDIRRSLSLACGQCVGCRLERSRQWAVRIMHEASLHESNSFVSLTYSDAFVPGVGLHYRHFLQFIRHLRERVGGPLRYYMCGEYGEERSRPHFHACLFGVSFPDKYFFKRTEGGFRLYRSPVLESLWKYGFSSVGEVTFESAAYVARYVMKKVTGAKSEEHYATVDQGTGVVFERPAEFCRMSLKPGIGADWLRLYWREVVQKGKVVARGVECNAPRFYMKRLSKLQGFELVELERDVSARLRSGDSSPQRLAVREAVCEARVSLLKRSLK